MDDTANARKNRIEDSMLYRCPMLYVLYAWCLSLRLRERLRTARKMPKKCWSRCKMTHMRGTSCSSSCIHTFKPNIIDPIQPWSGRPCPLSLPKDRHHMPIQRDPSRIPNLSLVAAGDSLGIARYQLLCLPSARRFATYRPGRGYWS